MLHMCFGIFSKRMSNCKKQIIEFARNMPLNIKKKKNPFNMIDWLITEVSSLLFYESEVVSRYM